MQSTAAFCLVSSATSMSRTLPGWLVVVNSLMITA